MKPQDLIAAATSATREALRDLFEGFPNEHFYYISLICSGPVPFLCAWSDEALIAAAATQNCEPSLLKWSYADSPFYPHRADLFELLREGFESCFQAELARFSHPVELAVYVAEQAMLELNREGVFDRWSDRNELVVGAEIMPPDSTNVARLKRLNPLEAIQAWLAEAGEASP